MPQSYQIVSQNDMQRKGGMRDAYITVRADGPFMRTRAAQVGLAKRASWFLN